MNILSIGAGYVGGPTMAVMAQYCPEHQFVVVDINKELIDKWNSRELPIYEPGLDEIVNDVTGVNLFFTTDVESAIQEADLIFISVCTPTKVKGEGAGKACNLKYVEQVARTIVDNVTHDCIVVEKTTVPVGTAGLLRQILRTSPYNIEVLNNPEFLAEGTAIADLRYPSRVIIGSSGAFAGREASKVLEDLYAKWIMREKIITMRAYSSEMTKLAANAMLAQRVSSINSLAEVCEATGADIQQVAKGIGSDLRIGGSFLNASIGFGGSCFKKDILNLVYMARCLGLDEVADYWDQVITMNEHQQKRLVKRMLKEMFGTLEGKKIAVFGFAFKANTGDVRETPVLPLCKALAEEGARLFITDPQALSNAEEAFDGPAYYRPDPYVCANNAHAIIIATEWPQYKDLNWQQIKYKMQEPEYLFDGRNLLNRRKMDALGFRYFGIGS